MGAAHGHRRRTILNAVAAGLAYVVVVFAVGFVLGTLRVLLLSPRLGETAAVLIELPIMLAVSWWSCRRLLARFDVSNAPGARLAMGSLAFAVLMLAELGVSVLGFGRTLAAHLGHYLELPALIGLAGQIAFAAFPILQRSERARTIE